MASRVPCSLVLFCLASLAFLLVQARSFLILPWPCRGCSNNPLASFSKWTGRFGFGLRLKRITGRRGVQLELVGKARGCSFLAPHLRKSPATERKHTKPTCFLCCEEGNDTRVTRFTSVCLNCYLDLIFVFLNAHAIFYPLCGKLLLFLSFPGIFGFCSRVGVGGELESDISISSTSLPFSCTMWANCQ